MKTLKQAASDFGQSLRFRRRYESMTLPDLQKASGISKGLLSRIENGKGNPSLHTIHRLASALNCHPCDLLAD